MILPKCYIEESHPELTPSSRAHFIWTPNHELTCEYEQGGKKFLLHSRYNPKQEAQRLVQAHLELSSDAFERLVIYGFGCGHHIQAVLQTSEDVMVEVVETNVNFFHQLLRQGDFQDILNHPRLYMRVTSNLDLLKGLAQDWIKGRAFLIIHQPLLRMIPDHLKSFRDVLENYKIFLNSAVSHKDLLEQNFYNNQQYEHPSVGRFMNKFSSVPVVMASAGPSLKKNIHLLHQAKEHALVCCVGTALKPLLQAGFQPDFFMMTDPKELVYEQIEGLEHANIPLFYLSTVYKDIPKRYRGPKFIVYQQGMEEAEMRAVEQKQPLIQTGGSVSTSLFDLLYQMGFDPICLIGQDLSFENNQTHVEGAHNNRQFTHLGIMEKTLSYARDKEVFTSKNLMIYLKWFETRAKKIENISLWNSTEGGAYISGFQHLSLSEFIQKHEHIDVLPFREKFFLMVEKQYEYGS